MESKLSCHQCKLPSLSLRGHEQKPGDTTLVGAGTRQSSSEANPIVVSRMLRPYLGKQQPSLGSG